MWDAGFMLYVGLLIGTLFWFVDYLGLDVFVSCLVCLLCSVNLG